MTFYNKIINTVISENHYDVFKVSKSPLKCDYLKWVLNDIILLYKFQIKDISGKFHSHWVYDEHVINNAVSFVLPKRPCCELLTAYTYLNNNIIL